jgi:uncharacterized protein
MMPGPFDFRCPIHGFVSIDDWELDIVNHWVFQRLRRIRQLAWTDYIYPGAMHTRFEHSLGVLETLSRMFDEVWWRHKAKLEALNFSDLTRGREKVFLRIAALLHDVGHSPFSHAGEGLMPIAENGKPYKHEEYSRAAIAHLMTDVIDNHPKNYSLGIKAEDVGDFISAPKIGLGHSLLFWRQLLSSQLDADRADYLLRDSHHIGVRYGWYDLSRLRSTLTVAADKETDARVLAIDEGGFHAAEALILARYQMFTQVYFHKTRVSYDYHITEVLRTLLAEAQKNSGLAQPDCWPPPSSKQNITSYLNWDDWRVLGLLHSGQGGNHGDVIRNRTHDRLVFEIPDRSKEGATELATKAKAALSSFSAHEMTPETSGYKFDKEISVATGDSESSVRPIRSLSDKSEVIKALRNIQPWRLYVPASKASEARKIATALMEELPNANQS